MRARKNLLVVRALLAMVVLAALAFVGERAYAISEVLADGCDEWNQLGWCPPYDDDSCDEACRTHPEIIFHGGSCNPVNGGFCCECML